MFQNFLVRAFLKKYNLGQVLKKASHDRFRNTIASRFHTGLQTGIHTGTILVSYWYQTAGDAQGSRLCVAAVAEAVAGAEAAVPAPA